MLQTLCRVSLLSMSTHWVSNLLMSSDARLSHFWMINVDLVILGSHTAYFDKSIKGGHCALHLTSVEYDRTNYGRYPPWYLRNMTSLTATSLSATHPDVDQYLEVGGFLSTDQ